MATKGNYPVCSSFKMPMMQNGKSIPCTMNSSNCTGGMKRGTPGVSAKIGKSK
jgi:hypothetical protein